MTGKTNILIESYSRLVTYDVLVQSFLRYSKIIPINVHSKLSREIRAEDIAWCDVMIIVRGDDPISEYLSDYLRKARRKVVLCLDDDLMEVRQSSDSLEDRYCFKSLSKVIQNSDLLLTNSNYLGEKYKKNYGLNFAIADTEIDESQIAHAPSCNDRNDIKLLYAASRGHRLYLGNLITPILNKLYERYGKRLSFTIIGPDIETKGILLNTKIIRPMPFDKYREYMNNHIFDIGLAPLPETEMSKSKYFNKYLEYSINGICGIYSNLLPYTLVVNDGDNGYLANNTPEDWFNCICEAIDNLDRTKQCIVNAQNHVLSNFIVDNIAKKLYLKMNDIFTFKVDDGKNPDSNLKNMRAMYISTSVYRNLLKTRDRMKQRGYKYVIIEMFYKIFKK